MDERLRAHMPTVAVVFVVGIALCSFALLQVHDNAAAMNVGAFSWAVFLIPCAFMLVCSFAVMMTADTIGRPLFLTVTGICFVAGVLSMIVTSTWFSDASIATALLANSDGNATVVPPVNNPVIVMRDIAAYIVCPTVGCIAGAWLGSRLHPVKR